QNVDGLDVVRVDVGSAILRYRSTRTGEVVRSDIRRVRLVVDRLAVDYEERLVRAGQRRVAANLDRCRRAGLSGLSTHLDVRCLCCESADDVLRTGGALNGGGVHRVDRRGETLTRGACACTRNNDL